MKMLPTFVVLILLSNLSNAKGLCRPLPEFPHADYSKKDKARELELCQLEFFNDDFMVTTKRGNHYIAACPKINSTNPGVDIYRVPVGIGRTEFIQNECKKRKRAGKKIAKYKQSVSCSYTPSILGYYPMSRFFKAGQVPVAVYREMAIDDHINNIQRTLKKIPLKGTIKLTWGTVLKATAKPRSFSKREFFFTEDLTNIFGALSKNPRGETRYKEMSGSYRSYDQRFVGFQKGKLFHNVIDRNFVEKLPAQSMAHLEKVVQLKDISDMLVMDYLMGQQDRVGNIHYKEYWAYMSGKGHLKYKSYDPEKKKDVAKMKAKGAVVVKRMLLKDNDCGVAKTNYFKAKKITEKITHINPFTYTQLNRLASLVETQEVETYFTKSLKFTNYNYKKFKENVKELNSLVRTKCQKGQLKLDADPEGYLKGHFQTSCDIE